MFLTAPWLTLLLLPLPLLLCCCPSCCAAATAAAVTPPPLLPLVREEDATDPVHGHITSLAVARSHRKMGIAAKLMSATRECQQQAHPCTYQMLQVSKHSLGPSAGPEHAWLYLHCTAGCCALSVWLAAWVRITHPAAGWQQYCMPFNSTGQCKAIWRLSLCKAHVKHDHASGLATH
jgi:GNAT superfamily N-acetyltransferase